MTAEASASLPPKLGGLVRRLYEMHQAGKINVAEARWIIVGCYGEAALLQLGRELAEAGARRGR